MTQACLTGQRAVGCEACSARIPLGLRQFARQVRRGAEVHLVWRLALEEGVESIEGGTRASSFEAKDCSTIYGSANRDIGLLC